MADLGADVVKLEPPTGDPSRRHGPFPTDSIDSEASGTYIYLNTNKRGISLDLTSRTGQEILQRLLPRFDVILASMSADDAEDFGLTYAEVSTSSPNAVLCSLSPFGQYGPYSRYAGYDITTSALGGICGYLGAEGRPLLAPPLGIGQYEAGVNAAISILMAKLADEGGQHIDLSEADLWATVQNGMGVIEFIFGAKSFTRMGRGVRSGPYPNTILPCKDGYIRLIAMQRREWERFLEVMGSPEWAKDERFQDRVRMNELHHEELDRHLSEWLRDKSKEEVFELCRAAGVPFAPIYTVAEVADHPHFEQWMTDVEGYSVVSFPYQLSTFDLGIRRPSPKLGEHNAEIFSEVGLNESQLEELFAVGII